MAVSGARLRSCVDRLIGGWAERAPGTTDLNAFLLPDGRIIDIGADNHGVVCTRLGLPLEILMRHGVARLTASAFQGRFLATVELGAPCSRDQLRTLRRVLEAHRDSTLTIEAETGRGYVGGDVSTHLALARQARKVGAALIRDGDGLGGHPALEGMAR